MCSDTDRARERRLGACLAGAGAELAAGAPAQPLPTREPLRAAAASSSAHASIIRPFNLNLNRRESFSFFINVMLSCCHTALAYACHYIRMSVNMYTLSGSVDTLDSSVVFERIDAHTLIGGPLRGLLAIPIPLYGKVCKYNQLST